LDLTTVQITGLLPASPARVYGAWLDAQEHTSFTGGRQTEIQGRVGAPFKAFDGKLWGKVTKLRTDKQLTFSLRADSFPEDLKDSKLEVTLTERPDGTSEIQFEQSGVPVALVKEFEGIWLDGYFTPMRSYFTLLSGRAKTPAGKPPAKAGAKGAKGAHRAEKAASATKAAPAKAAAAKAAPAKAASKKASSSPKATDKKATTPPKPAPKKTAPASKAAAKSSAKKPSAAKKPATSKASAASAGASATKTATKKTTSAKPASTRARTAAKATRAPAKKTASAAASRSKKKTAARAPKKATSGRRRS
jgi:uncharacterized protein YndB with AHSA1/START domain